MRPRVLEPTKQTSTARFARGGAPVIGVVALALLAGCHPDDGGSPTAPKPPPGTTAPPLSVAPCKKTWVTDGFTDEGIDTRTGCMVVAMTLGSVTGALDLSLPVALVRDEGLAPPSDLYQKAWFGSGTWLSTDEYVTDDSTSDKDIKLTLHTPNGDVVYDTLAKAPWAEPGDPDLGDDSKVPLRAVWRSRPFDGTVLRWTSGAYLIRSGNPGDTRSLTRVYADQFRGTGSYKPTYRLSSLSKASIYRGPLNTIEIKRSYGDPDVSVTFTSTMYDGSAAPPLEIKAALARDDGDPGSMIEAKTTLLHGWASTVRAYLDEKGNVERVVSGGRKPGEAHTSVFTYTGTDKPETTVFATIVEKEGAASSARALRSLEIKERADGASTTWPYAIKSFVDHSRPGADRTSVVKECDSKASGSIPAARPTYFTFNRPDGTSVATEYAGDDSKNVPVRAVDEEGRLTMLQYNSPQGGGTPNARVPGTAYELKWVHLPNASPGISVLHRFDRFSLDTYNLPFVGKVAISSGLVDKAVLHRALYGTTNDPLNGDRVIATFDAPRMQAGPDGRVAMEYRGLDGFTYETIDEAGVVIKHRWVSTEKSPDGTYATETIDSFLMDAPQTRVVRDRYGRLVQRVDFEPALAMNAQPTSTYSIRPDGFVDKISDTGTGELFEVLAWNAPRSAITKAQVTIGGTVIRSFEAQADDFGGGDGTSTVTLEPIQTKTTHQRGDGGVLLGKTVSGPGGRSVATTLDYADGDAIPRSRSINGQSVESVTQKPLAANGDCK